MHRRSHRLILLLYPLFAFAAGCTSLAPVTIRGERFNYNEAGFQSTNEQLLLNIVRLRYGKPADFMELTSVVSQYAVQSRADFSTCSSDPNVRSAPAPRAGYDVDGEPGKQASWGANVTYTGRPTITYTPLQGEEFARRLMTPIDPVTVIYLTEAGLEIDRLLDCCVQRINGIPNPRLIRCTAAQSVADGRFRRVAGLLRTVQEAGGLCFTVESDGPAVYLGMHQQPTTEAQQELRELLGIPLGVDRLRLTSRSAQGAPDELTIQTPSLLATLNALSENVVSPRDHKEAGNVVPGTAAGGGEPPEAWLRVVHSALPAADAFAQVHYNGYWYHIPQSDLRSKRTFALLSYLLFLQATWPRGALPLAVHCGSVSRIPAGSETPAVVDRPSLMDPETRTSKQDQNDGIDERALAAIRRMTGLLSKSDRFAFKAHTVWESIRESGVRLEAEAVQQLWLDRPSRMFTTAVRDDGTSDKMWYREKTLTHLKVDTREYVQVSVPETIDEMLAYTKERFELPGALNGFLRNDAESWFLSGTRTAMYLGERLVQEIECEYVLLRKQDVDIQVWIRKGARPLPVKYSIMWNDAADRPKLTARFLEWELSPTFSERVFVFIPPEGAEELNLDGSWGRVKD